MRRGLRRSTQKNNLSTKLFRRGVGLIRIWPSNTVFLPTSNSERHRLAFECSWKVDGIVICRQALTEIAGNGEMAGWSHESFNPYVNANGAREDRKYEKSIFDCNI